MRQLTALAACLLITFAAAACGGGTAGPSSTLLETPEPTPTPTYVPVVASIDQAIGIAIGSSTADRASVVLAEAMTAQESADKTHELGFGSIPMISPADWKCPDSADCPYPGEPGGDHGYLIITRLSGALNVGASTSPSTGSRTYRAGRPFRTQS